MRRVLVSAVVTLATVVACKKPEAPPAAPAAAAPANAAPTTQLIRGKVVEKVDVAQYTYLKLATSSGDTWTAVQKTDKNVGDEVGVGNAFPMQNFESKELNRKFDVVYFGTLAGPNGEVAALPPAMGGGQQGAMPASAEAPSPMGGAMGGMSQQDMAAQHKAAAAGRADVKVEKVAKASGADGRTVEEIWAQKDKLKGKTVAVRGQIVKFTPVMGKNFLHIRDGSGSAEKNDNDVTVTSQDAAAVGDVVTAKGTVITDKDFGAGYAYPVMVDGAKLTK